MWVILALAACGEPDELAQPGPEQHRFVGRSADGNRVAVVLTRGGERELLVLESGHAEPLYRGPVAARGIDAHGPQLTDLLIDRKAVPVPVEGQWPDVPASSGIIQGFVDVFPEPVAFRIEPDSSATCDHGMHWGVAAGPGRSGAAVLHPDCIEDVSLSRVYRGEHTLWFVTGEQTSRGRMVGVAGVAF